MKNKITLETRENKLEKIKKKGLRKTLFTTVMSMGVLLGCTGMLVGCGEAGPKGDTGATGPAGPQGVAGSSFLTDEGVPASTYGANGDVYLDTTTFNLYKKVDGAWTGLGNIKGEQGEPGNPGEPGTSSYTHIKYSANEPNENADMSDIKNDWIGIYTGTSATAPTDYNEYTWYKIKGDNPSITFDDEGYIVIDGVKSEICIYTQEIEHEFIYNSTTLSNYEYKVMQGNALQTSGTPMNNRVSLWFDYKFKAGTEFKLIGDLATYKAGFSVSRDGKEYDGRESPTLAEDSGWIDNATASGDLNVGTGSIKHHYDKDTKTFTLSKDSYVRINFKYANDANLTTSTYDWANFVEINGNYLEQSKSIHITTDDQEREVVDYGMNSVAHRGYSTIAPENTLAAYRLAKEKGFDIAECDVTFTSDGVGVLLHDDTINRTSNGTGRISEMTLEEVRQYDFGSWKSSEYIGEKIPTFEEFIHLCKYLAIHPYIEIKGGATQQNVESLVTTVTRCGMLDKVTWISFDINTLTYVKQVDETARLGYLATNVTETKITELKGLRTGKNEVFFNADNTNVTEAIIERCIEELIPLEVCTIDDINVISNLHPYISGVTSNDKIAGKILYEKYNN